MHSRGVGLATIFSSVKAKKEEWYIGKNDMQVFKVTRQASWSDLVDPLTTDLIPTG